MALQARKRIQEDVKGQFASPRGEVGTYIPNRATSGSLNVGLAHDGTLGMPEYLWTLSPQFQMGIASLDPQAAQPGSNLQAVADTTSTTARDSGMDGTPTGSSVGGTAAY
jgi:hypothetical protein